MHDDLFTPHREHGDCGSWNQLTVIALVQLCCRTRYALKRGDFSFMPQRLEEQRT